jgi:NAD(P)-dependent dehydrogenase (short-subunit alcohol dehydrogenase family)
MAKPAPTRYPRWQDNRNAGDGMGALDGKKVVVIGGSGGIGYATAAMAHREGAHVVLTSRDQGRAEAAATKIAGKAGRTTPGAVEVGDRKATAAFLERHGKFDHLVLTGSTVHRLAFDALPEKESYESFDSKFWGPFWAAYDGRHHMNKGGSIIFYSGAASRRPLRGYVVGAAIDGAIDAATRSLAGEMGKDGIRVNCISPGVILTDLIRKGRTQAEFDKRMEEHSKRVPLGRIGEPEECANAALFLMTCGFVTGEVLAVDGGTEAAP